MRRTQLYLDDDLWNALHVRARSEGTTISDLVRQAIRDRYVGKLDDRRRAMLNVIGMRKDESEHPDGEEQVRRLRNDHRLQRLIRR